MRTRVTVIVVAQQGGEWLDHTLAGLAAQTRAPDRIVAVLNGGPARVAEQFSAGGADLVVQSDGRLPFGQAVQRGIHATGPSTDGAGGATGETRGEWIWLLSEDACPEPEALSRILSTVERSPSVGLAGPKLVDWDRPERIIELGQSLTRYGSRWLLRRQELDQQQYDHLQDVLGVGPVGLLVRREVWEQLDGFDPALPVFDDGLDLSVRARLAGYRVVVSPGSRVRFAQSGVAGPRIDRRRAVMRTAHRQGRTAHLHRRIAYAPAFFAFFMWLGLPVLGVLRVFWALIREQPGQMLGELAAAFRVFLRPGAIIASRRRIKRDSSAGWEAVSPLRVDPKAVRTARMIDREAILAAQGRRGRELHFVSTGGLAVLIGAVVLAATLCWWALAQTALTGGALAPLSPIGELWEHTRTLDGVPADPFSWVLAVLGSLTFWNPSHAVVLFYVAAIPLAALGGWIWGAQLTSSSAGRALIGVAWAISPVLLGSLGSGRLPTLILAVVLPWLLLAATRCRESWSWAGTASLLAAVALACAPILVPAAVVLLLVGAFSSLRGVTRVLTTAIAPLVLFLPKATQVVLSGRPLDLLLDPGITPAYQPGSPWHQLLGFPEFGLEGWAGILEQIGLGGPPATLLVGVLFLPLALTALLGLITGRVVVTVLNALLGGLGMLTAIAASNLQLVSVGAESVALWTGSGLALYWISVLGLAAVGAETLQRASVSVVAVVLVGAALVIAPLGVQLVTANSGIVPGASQMPALVQAAGQSNPDVRTLQLTATGEHAVRAEIIVGTGVRLDQVRSAARLADATDEDEELARLVGSLASAGGVGLSDRLSQQSIDFVLLDPRGDADERAQLQAVLDQHAELSNAGQTDYGLLWRAAGGGGTGEALDEVSPVAGTSVSGHTLWLAQALVLLGIVLLALPTGEVVERPQRRRRPKTRKRERIAARVVGAGATAGSAAEDGDDPADGDGPEDGGDPAAAARDDADPGSDPEAGAEPDSDSDSDAEPASDSESDADTADADPGTDSSSRADVEPAPDIESGPQTRPELDADDGSGSNAAPTGGGEQE